MRIDSAEFVRAAHGGEDFIADGRPQVAFVGRSNVGKSSLMNRLLGRKGLARTSSTPGRTRSINYFLINRRCYFVDLPGYGYAKAAKRDRQSWAELVDRYFRHAGGEDREGMLARIVQHVQVVQLIDAKVGATPLDVEAHAYLTSFGSPVTVVATKIDRVGKGRRAQALAAIAGDLGSATEPISVSAVSGEGIKDLWRVIDDHLQGS